MRFAGSAEREKREVKIKHIWQGLCLAALVASVAGCSGGLGTRDLRTAGTYTSYMTESVRDGAMRCVARAKVYEKLGVTGLDCTMSIDLTFHFSGAIEFQDVRVSYLTELTGDWGVDGDTLRLMPDTLNMKSEFIGSNASNNVEEAMVRQLRRNVIADIQPKIRQQYMRRSRMAFRMLSSGDSGIFGVMPDSSVVIFKKIR